MNKIRLRGWVPQSAVQSEFDDIKRHYNLSNACESCKMLKITCTHEMQRQNTWQAIKELFRKRSLKPYFILTVLCGVTAFTGSRQLIVYLVPILKAYRSPVNPNFGMVRLQRFYHINLAKSSKSDWVFHNKLGNSRWHWHIWYMRWALGINNAGQKKTLHLSRCGCDIDEFDFE